MSFVTFQTPACEVCGEPATNKIDGAYLCAHHATIYDNVKIVLRNTYDDDFNGKYIRKSRYAGLISMRAARDLWRQFISPVALPLDLA